MTSPLLKNYLYLGLLDHMDYLEQVTGEKATVTAGIAYVSIKFMVSRDASHFSVFAGGAWNSAQ